MRLLLDTHILVWFATDRASLSRAERTALEDSAGDLHVSAISLWELRAKARAGRRKKRIELTLDPAGAIAFCERAGIIMHEIMINDVTVRVEVDPVHGDPFDEMMILHAQQLGARLLTRDRYLVDHPLAYQP